MVLSGELHRPIGELDALRERLAISAPSAWKTGDPGVRRRVRLRFEQTCRPGQPAAADRAGLAAKSLIGEDQRDARGIARLAGVGVAGKGPFQRLGGLVGLSRPTRPPCPAARGRPPRGHRRGRPRRTRPSPPPRRAGSSRRDRVRVSRPSCGTRCFQPRSRAARAYRKPTVSSVAMPSSGIRKRGGSRAPGSAGKSGPAQELGDGRGAVIYVIEPGRVTGLRHELELRAGNPRDELLGRLCTAE